MTRIRRSLLLLGIVAAVVVTGAGSAAEASFADSAAVPTTQIATTVVAAPATGPGSLTCGKSTATMGLTWTKSTTPSRVSGYLVTVYFSDGYTDTRQMAASDTSWSAPINLINVQSFSVRYSVTTQTDYKWTAESSKTAWFHC